MKMRSAPSGLPTACGQTKRCRAKLAQVLPTTRHFEQASELVTPEMVAEQVPCGPDPDRHIEAINAYAEAGFDELYIQQIGPDQADFFAAYSEHVLPRVRDRVAASVS